MQAYPVTHKINSVWYYNKGLITLPLVSIFLKVVKVKFNNSYDELMGVR